MATFSVAIQVGDLQGQRYESLQALVDTRASHLVVPRPVLSQLGIPIDDRWTFQLADNRVVDHDVSQVRVRVEGRGGFTRVVFGEPDGPTLLGATMLEIFNLGVEPVRQHLIPVTGLLM